MDYILGNLSDFDNWGDNYGDILVQFCIILTIGGISRGFMG